MLAAAGHSVVAIDRSREAIDYARTYYAHERAQYICADAANFRGHKNFDAVTCFETIEHLADPAPLLREFRKAAPLLLASIPNEAVFPFLTAENGFQGWRFHCRHYTHDDFEDLLKRTGFRAQAWFGQYERESDVLPDVNGRTLVVKAVHEESTPAVAPAEPIAAAEPRSAPPRHVAIVGLGPSGTQFFEIARGLGGATAYCDEVWAVNALGDVLKCDRVFHMDDVLVQERRAAARPGSNIARMVDWLKRHPGPIYTSTVRSGYPGLVAFPLEEVLNGGYDTNGGAPYFNNTVAYAIAYAVHIGVKRISLFGIDFTRPSSHHAEQGRACCEFWLGIAAARGVEITIPDTSTLLDACAPDAERLYGYDGVEVIFHDADEGKVRLEMRPKELPTAEEIERRYDHSRHPNRLINGDKS